MCLCHLIKENERGAIESRLCISNSQGSLVYFGLLFTQMKLALLSHIYSKVPPQRQSHPLSPSFYQLMYILSQIMMTTCLSMGLCVQSIPRIYRRDIMNNKTCFLCELSPIFFFYRKRYKVLYPVRACIERLKTRRYSCSEDIMVLCQKR